MQYKANGIQQAVNVAKCASTTPSDCRDGLVVVRGEATGAAAILTLTALAVKGSSPDTESLSQTAYAAWLGVSQAKLSHVARSLKKAGAASAEDARQRIADKAFRVAFLAAHAEAQGNKKKSERTLDQRIRAVVRWAIRNAQSAAAVRESVETALRDSADEPVKPQPAAA